MMNTSILPYLQEQLSRHPGMKPRDVLKLCYQGAYGGDHLLTDWTQARVYFEQEYAGVLSSDEPLYELISPAMARVNLRAWKKAGLPGEWLFRLFTCSAKMPAPGNLSAYLQEASTLSLPGFAEARATYEAEGCPSVHHSEAYRQLEKPAYRVVHQQLLRLIPILERAALIQVKSPRVIAIDGRAASGKTTMADQLAFVLEAGVIHMDHFFLPPALRTPVRLDEPGGNVHYERFQQEVLPYIWQTEAFSYRRFDCSQMDYGSSVTVPAASWRIVEGSYSLHPAFGEYYDLSVFSSVSPEEQLKRIEARNGGKMLRLFREKWIPMEEKYFTTYPISENAAIRCLR